MPHVGIKQANPVQFPKCSDTWKVLGKHLESENGSSNKTV